MNNHYMRTLVHKSDFVCIFDESKVNAPSETGSSVTKSRHQQNLSACDPHSASSCPISNANSEFAPARRCPEQMASQLNCKQNIPRAPHFLCAALPWLKTPFCMVQVVLSVVCQKSSRIAQCSCSCRTASAATTMSRTPSAPMSCSVIAHSALPEGRIGRMANALSSAGYEPNVQLSDQFASEHSDTGRSSSSTLSFSTCSVSERVTTTENTSKGVV